MAEETMTGAEWIERYVAPAAKETQDRARFWPVAGVGPYAAVLRLDDGSLAISSASGPNATKEACAKLREVGVRPIAMGDYLSTRAYGNQAMIAALARVREQALEEGVAIIGGESSEHNFLPDDFSLTIVWAFGIASK